MSVSNVSGAATLPSTVKGTSTLPASSAKEAEMSIAAAVLPSIAGKIVSTWPQSVMIAGIVAAVVGVAAAVLTSSLFAGIGFALLGVISIVGVFVAQDAFEGAELQNSIALLGRQNTFLDQQTAKVELTSKQIIAENAKLKSAQVTLGQKADELQKENQRIIQANKDLEKALQDLAAANRSIREGSASLERRIADMKQVVVQANQILQTFLRRNLEFASSVGAFASASAGLGRTEAEIQGTLAEFERVTTEEIPQIRAQIELAQALSDRINTHMTEQNESLRRISEGYAAQITRLDATVAGLTASIQSYERLAADFIAREDSIRQATTAMESARGGLTALAPTVEAQIQAIAAQRERLAAEVIALTGVKDALIAELARLRGEFDALVSSKRAELATLQEQLRLARAPA